MELLPYVDEHSRQVGATVERTWAAVLALVRGRLTRPAPSAFAALWDLEPKSGFAVAEETAPRHLALRAATAARRNATESHSGHVGSPIRRFRRHGMGSVDFLPYGGSG